MMQPPPLPKYFQLAEQLRQQITNGRYQPHDKLPSEETLCQTYQVSRGTVRQAMRRLQDEGLIYREHGKGTFVTPPTPPTPTLFSLTDFADEMQRQNRQPTTQLLTAEIIPATQSLATQLKTAVAQPLIHIVRLRLANNQPVIYEERYLAQSLCPHLLDENLETSAIHWLLIHKYQIPLVRMTHTVEIGRLSTEQAVHLQTEAGQPAFFIDRLTFTLDKNQQKIPAVWFRAICNEQQYRIGAKEYPHDPDRTRPQRHPTHL